MAYFFFGAAVWFFADILVGAKAIEDMDKKGQ